MAADREFHDQVMHSLASLGVFASKSMFGGFGIFTDGTMFALISGSALFFKVDDSNRARYEDVDSKQYGSMPYYRVPGDVLEDEAKLLDWARISIAIAQAAPKKSKR